MRSRASSGWSRTRAALLLASLIAAAPTIAAPQDPATQAAEAPAEETIEIEQVTRLYEGPSPVFKKLGELKAGTKVRILKKDRSWAKMHDTTSDLEGYGVLPAAKREQKSPQQQPLTITLRPTPTRVGLVTKGLGDELRHKSGRDVEAVKRMEEVRFTPDELAAFIAELARSGP